MNMSDAWVLPLLPAAAFVVLALTVIALLA